MTFGGGPPRTVDGYGVAAVALAVRLLVVAWAGRNFPPAQDGHFYHVVAERIARGLGYTWLWPDGTVTFAAHYPVGYPAFVGAGYWAVGPEPWVGMAQNAVLGALGVLAVHRIAARAATRAGALAAGLVVALHPGLVAYTVALMTEAVLGSLLALATWATLEAPCGSPRRRNALAAVVGVLLGACILVRPQTTVVVPFFAWMTGVGRPRRVWVAATVCALAVAVAAPWTIRNCARLDHCAFVSANGGWNLLIGGGSGANGAWVPIETIDESRQCAGILDEAAKDRCFARAAWSAIRAKPAVWLALVPTKLAATFDSAGAGAWYLHASNPAAWSAGARDRLAAADLVMTRLILLLALVAAALAPGPRRRLRWGLTAVAVPFAVSPIAWPAYLSLVTVLAALGPALLVHGAAWSALAVVAATASTHAVFFGASRYALPCIPVLGALAGTVLTLRPSAGDTPDEETPRCR